MSNDLGLEPSDPLNLLLHNTARDEDASEESPSAQDWSKFSSMWSDQPQPALKSYPDLMEFADLGMDLDYSSMGIEPSALHFSPGFNFSFDENSLNDVYPQFAFQYPPPPQDMDLSSSPDMTKKERRLSVTSSSSSSGASLSPVPESMPSPASDNSYQKEANSFETAPYADDPAAELAHRVRQTAGVMLAVPMNGYTAGLSVPNASQGKLPTPRLSRHSSPRSSNESTSSSAASTPPPSTPPSSIGSPLNSGTPDTSNVPTPTTTAPTAGLPRPKTSHTTIERRYRTNLNARIQSLRMAVPALRVLEDKEGGGKKIKKNVKGGVVVKGTGIGLIESEDGTVVDVIDERGFVDGVKVARKCSKANVLGKAVEYIRVLKKREQRLKAEQAGLKTLVGGLVGGPALVREWENQWKAQFGGEEKDEVEGDEEADDDDSDDEDGEDGDEETGKKRKRPKLAAAVPKKPVEKKERKPAPTAVVMTSDAAGNPVVGKRKRGRPRKILPPPPVAHQAVASAADEVMHLPTPAQSQWTQQQTQPQQYLLAVFALFSFFNSPLTSSPVGHGYHHTGKVLSVAHPPLAYSPEIVSQFVTPTAPAGWLWKEYVQLFHLLVSFLILGTFVCNWLGFNFGMGKAPTRGRSVSIRPFRRTRSAARPAGAAGWLKIAQESVLEGDSSSLSYFERLQIYRAISSKRTASVSDLATASIAISTTTSVLGSLARMKAKSLWISARHQAEKQQQQVSARLVMQSVDFTDATARLSSASSKDRTDGERTYTPIEVLGCLVVKERVKEHLSSLFVDTVGGQDSSKEDEEWRTTIEAARELGGHIEELGKLLERVWKSSDASAIDEADIAPDAASEFDAGVDGEIQALLTALVLYRRLFGDSEETECLSSSTSSLLSPPPSPSPTKKKSNKQGRMLFSLRKALGSRVFEDVDDVDSGEAVMSLEDVRDRVVDMIVDAERRERGASPTS